MSRTNVRLANVKSATCKAWLKSLNLHDCNSRKLTLRNNSACEAGEMARAGWLYLGDADRVQCISCSGVAREWREGNDPLLEHLAQFPWCSLAQTRNKDRETISEAGEDKTNFEKAAQVIAYPLTEPAIPAYTSIKEQSKTFERRPR